MSKRIEWIDIYRGLGILLMVAGHVGFGSVFDKVIHGFHMPMWFFISGYLFQPGKRSLTGTIKHRAKKLMVPYYINLFVYYLFWLVFEKGFQNGAYTCLKSLCSMSLNIKSPIAGGAQWFLCALFLADVFYEMLDDKLSESKCLMGISVFILSIIGCGLPLLINRIPFSIDAALVALAFYHLGHIAKNKEILNRIPAKPWFVCLSGCLTIIIALVNGKVNMRAGTYSNLFLFYFGALTGIAMVFSLSTWLDRLSFTAVDKMKKWIEFMGRESIGFLCCNVLVIKILRLILEKIPAPKIVIRFALLFTTLAVISIIVVLYRKLFHGNKKRRITT